MLYTLLLIFAIIGYLIAAALIGSVLRATEDKLESKNQQRIFKQTFLLACCSGAAHLIYAANLSQFSFNQLNAMPSTLSLNFSLSSMAALISAMLVVIYLLGSLAMPIKRLGIIVYPLAAVSLLFSYLWHSEAYFLGEYGRAFAAHILISILAYSLLAIAVVQALLYIYQERQIKNRSQPAMLLALPPLQTMEQLLFRLVGVGFILLSFTLFTGALFSQQIFGQPFEFKHHTVLASLGWLTFAVLLFKRYRYGLRGSNAVTWIISGFVLIQLGYFGTKIVTESLNIQ